ncbi:MAG: hypothetical protein K8Q89_10225 [Nitrosarchaeum sp.]|nr:hypothetical protein [Nitrosarchaeum sp.]
MKNPNEKNNSISTIVMKIALRIFVLLIITLGLTFYLVKNNVQIDTQIVTDLLPSSILFLFWTRQMIKQTENLKQKLIRKNMDIVSAHDIAYGEFRSSFFYETLIIGIINAVIILYRSENSELVYRFEYWPLFVSSFVILGITCIVGYFRKTIKNENTVPFLAIMASSVIGAQIGVLLFSKYAYVAFVNCYLFSFVLGVIVFSLQKWLESRKTGIVS